MRLYIAGPMSNMPEHNIPAFEQAERDLRDEGHDVSNPAQHGAGEGTWADYMRRDIADLLTCDAVALLPGWERSKGATLEVHIAEQLEMPIRPIEEWL